MTIGRKTFQIVLNYLRMRQEKQKPFLNWMSLRNLPGNQERLQEEMIGCSNKKMKRKRRRSAIVYSTIFQQTLMLKNRRTKHIQFAIPQSGAEGKRNSKLSFPSKNQMMLFNQILRNLKQKCKKTTKIFSRKWSSQQECRQEIVAKTRRNDEINTNQQLLLRGFEEKKRENNLVSQN